MSEVSPPLSSGAMKVAYSSRDVVRFTPGRRPWISYRDLGVVEASGGAMRAEVMHIDNAGTSRPTGWHYHTAEMQFLMVTEGWVKIEFSEGVTTVRAGDSLLIPGGVIHQELESSEPLRLLEISVPAEMGTVAVDASADRRGRVEGKVESKPAT